MHEVKITELAEARNGPRLLTFPPLVPLATIALAAVLQWALPINLFTSIPVAVRTAVGGTLCAAGVALLVGGIQALRSHLTAIHPSHPTRTLVTGGAFGITRNPLYVGGSLVMLSGALLSGLGWLFVLSAPCLLTLHFGIVLPEEAYLEGKFGELYRQYKAQVPRYLVSVGRRARAL